MRSKQSGKGFIPILLLIVGAVILVILFVSKDSSLKNDSPNDTSTPVSLEQESQPQSNGVVELMLDPAEVNSAANGTFSLNVKVDPKTEAVSAVDLKLTYDPIFLEATSIKGDPSLPIVLVPGKVMEGSATIVVGSNPTTPVKDIGTIATVTFKAKKTGTTSVSIDNTSQATAVGKTGNVLGPATATSVTIK